jgi:hypothetical protein
VPKIICIAFEIQKFKLRGANFLWGGATNVIQKWNFDFFKFKQVCVLQRRACTQIQHFKRNYLENYNDSEHAVKTKNAPFFMIFQNISFFHMVVNYWTGPLKRLIGIPF